jgi:hypothetical protein
VLLTAAESSSTIIQLFYLDLPCSRWLDDSL